MEWNFSSEYFILSLKIFLKANFLEILSKFSQKWKSLGKSTVLLIYLCFSSFSIHSEHDLKVLPAYLFEKMKLIFRSRSHIGWFFLVSHTKTIIYYAFLLVCHGMQTIGKYCGIKRKKLLLIPSKTGLWS